MSSGRPRSLTGWNVAAITLLVAYLVGLGLFCWTALVKTWRRTSGPRAPAVRRVRRTDRLVADRAPARHRPAGLLRLLHPAPARDAELLAADHRRPRGDHAAARRVQRLELHRAGDPVLHPDGHGARPGARQQARLHRALRRGRLHPTARAAGGPAVRAVAAGDHGAGHRHRPLPYPARPADRALLPRPRRGDRVERGGHPAAQAAGRRPAPRHHARRC